MCQQITKSVFVPCHGCLQAVPKKTKLTYQCLQNKHNLPCRLVVLPDELVSLSSESGSSADSAPDGDPDKGKLQRRNRKQKHNSNQDQNQNPDDCYICHCPRLVAFCLPEEDEDDSVDNDQHGKGKKGKKHKQKQKRQKGRQRQQRSEEDAVDWDDTVGEILEEDVQMEVGTWYGGSSTGFGVPGSSFDFSNAKFGDSLTKPQPLCGFGFGFGSVTGPAAQRFNNNNNNNTHPHFQRLPLPLFRHEQFTADFARSFSYKFEPPRPARRPSIINNPKYYFGPRADESLLRRKPVGTATDTTDATTTFFTSVPDPYLPPTNPTAYPPKRRRILNPKRPSNRRHYPFLSNLRNRDFPSDPHEDEATIAASAMSTVPKHVTFASPLASPGYMMDLDNNDNNMKCESESKETQPAVNAASTRCRFARLDPEDYFIG